MSTEVNNREPEGIYLAILGPILRFRWLIPLWTAWHLLFERVFKATIRVGTGHQLHPAVPEAYQCVMMVLLAVGLSAAPSQAPWASVAFGLAAYRAWEILVYGLKWVLVDRGPVYDFRRSLLAFLFNLFEVAAAYTIMAFRMNPDMEGQQWQRTWENVGLAFKLEVPQALQTPYGTLFTVEASFLVLIVLVCVLGGIQRGSLLDSRVEARAA
jgi:hypothetical protein